MFLHNDLHDPGLGQSARVTEVSRVTCRHLQKGTGGMGQAQIGDKATIPLTVYSMSTKVMVLKKNILFILLALQNIENKLLV